MDTRVLVKMRFEKMARKKQGRKIIQHHSENRKNKNDSNEPLKVVGNEQEVEERNQKTHLLISIPQDLRNSAIIR